MSIKISKNEAYTICGFLFVVFLRFASELTANLSFFVLAAYATLGPSQAIKALALCWFLTMISPGIAPEANLGTVGRYLVFLMAFLSVFSRSRMLTRPLCYSRMSISVGVFGVLIILHSLFVSSLFMVSILKVASWVMVTGTLFSAWAGLTAQKRRNLEEELVSGLLMIMLVSIPIYFMSLGYIRNGTGFQGILNHPQVFGATMAVLASLAMSNVMSKAKPSWKSLIVFTVALFFVFSSEARTAGLALFLAVLITSAVAPLAQGKKIRTLFPGLRSKKVSSVIGALVSVSILFTPQIADKLDSFISKSGRAGAELSVADAYEMSRGDLVEDMLENIKKYPVTGIGFGIASNPELMKVDRDPFLGLPISASIEKGVMPIAVIEELGVPISMLVFIWLLKGIQIAAYKGPMSLSLILTVLFINMGEYVFFSPGGMGMLILISFTWAATRQEEVQLLSGRL